MRGGPAPPIRKPPSAALADMDFVREAGRLGLPLAPRIGADDRNDVAALETQLRGLWQRRPWKDS